MDARHIDALLAPTLEDRRLTRGERGALRQVLLDLTTGAADLDLVRDRAFALAREELPAGPGAAALDWLAEIVRLLDGLRPAASSAPRAEAYFSPGSAGPASLVALLRGAATTVDVCVFTITDDRLTSALLDAHRRGVRVRIVTDDEKAADEGSDIARLRAAGIPVVTDDSEAHMHHKFAVVDGVVLATGSYNWTRSAAESNRENLIITDDPRLVSAHTREFDRLWSEFPPADPSHRCQVSF